jgi:hypothetical protein
VADGSGDDRSQGGDQIVTSPDAGVHVLAAATPLQFALQPGSSDAPELGVFPKLVIAGIRKELATTERVAFGSLAHTVQSLALASPGAPVPMTASSGIDVTLALTANVDISTDSIGAGRTRPSRTRDEPATPTSIRDNIQSTVDSISPEAIDPSRLAELRRLLDDLRRSEAETEPYRITLFRRLSDAGSSAALVIGMDLLKEYAEDGLASSADARELAVTMQTLLLRLPRSSEPFIGGVWAMLGQYLARTGFLDDAIRAFSAALPHFEQTTARPQQKDLFMLGLWLANTGAGRGNCQAVDAGTKFSTSALPGLSFQAQNLRLQLWDVRNFLFACGLSRTALDLHNAVRQVKPDDEPQEKWTRDEDETQKYYVDLEQANEREHVR